MRKEVVNMGYGRVVVPYRDMIIAEEAFATLIAVQRIPTRRNVLAPIVLRDDQVLGIGVMSNSNKVTG